MKQSHDESERFPIRKYAILLAYVIPGMDDLPIGHYCGRLKMEGRCIDFSGSLRQPFSTCGVPGTMRVSSVRIPYYFPRSVPFQFRNIRVHLYSNLQFSITYRERRRPQYCYTSQSKCTKTAYCSLLIITKAKSKQTLADIAHDMATKEPLVV